jgi:hypothetical protein
MNIVPLISVKKGQLFDGKDGTVLSIDDLFTRVEKDAMLYVLDYDGINNNNPNLELYQRLTEHCTLWIDDGPRRIDDVMDTIMSGATNLTLRTEFWPDVDVPGVLELTDDEIYFAIGQESQRQSHSLPFMQDGIGAVIFENETQISGDFTYGSTLKELAGKYKIYLYNVLSNNRHHLEEFGVTGILVDLSKKEGDLYGF